MVVAGEASGDEHGARLVKAVKALAPDLGFVGIGGRALRQAGVEITIDNSELAVVGIAEVLPKINVYLRALRSTKRVLQRLRPVLLVLIDFPDFNLRVAKAARRLGIPVMYYISPQVWAWRSGRVKEIKKIVDHMAVIFPFEVDFYERQNVPVTFVGHPLMDVTDSGGGRDEDEDMRGEGLLIGLLPGSRNGEIHRLLPVMVRVAEILSAHIKEVRFVIPLASSVDPKTVDLIVRGAKADIAVRSGKLPDVLRQAKLVITASGTVTLEAAIAGTPMIIMYKVSPLSYLLGRHLIRVKHIGLANLIADGPVVPEFIQHQASAEKVAAQALKMIGDEKGLSRIRRELRGVARKLGGPGASRRAAELALQLISNAKVGCIHPQG